MNALERYVALPDPSYRWKATAALPGGGYTSHLIELVSQRWRDEGEVNRPRWRHQLRLVMPDEIANDTALLVIAGGSNDKPVPARANPMLAIAAMMTRSVTAELRMVPNQPLTFAEKPIRAPKTGSLPIAGTSICAPATRLGRCGCR